MLYHKNGTISMSARGSQLENGWMKIIFYEFLGRRIQPDMSTALLGV